MSADAMPRWQRSLQRTAIWAAFFALLYLMRDFFFLAFMTFMFSYVALNLTAWLMGWLAPADDRPRLRTLLTIGLFIAAPLGLLVAMGLVLPALFAQGQHLIGWLSHTNPETEIAQLAEKYLGPSEFRAQYGDANDPRYVAALADYAAGGAKQVAAYHQFPQVANWLESGIAPPPGPLAPHQAELYREQFRKYCDRRHAQAPKAMPYTYEEFIALQKAYPEGPHAFGETLEKLRPELASNEAVRADFEATKRRELFRIWWSTSPGAAFVRKQLASGVSSDRAGQLERALSGLINIPIDLGTALLLSFFICFDFPTLQRACNRLADTWLHGAYDELAPALSNLAVLIGRAMQAQSLISLCNSALLYLAMLLLGVEHPLLLAAACFVFCLVPTLGTLIAWVLLAGVALVQPGGGLMLAAEISAAVGVVILLEMFVFSPRILGKMMELHPVLIIAILPLAQSFFGIWGLILATPVTVYVINDVILRTGAAKE